MAAGRLHDRHAGALDRVGEVLGRADAVAEVVRLDALLQSLRDRLEVSSGEPAVGREALGEDEEIPAALGERVVVHREPAADVAHRILLRAHGHAVRERGHLADDVGHVLVGVALLAGLDEPGVLREPAGVEEQRHVMAVADLPDAAQVLERHRLPASRVVRDRDHHDRNVLRPRLEQRVERLEVHVPLERVHQARLAAFRNDEVDCVRARRLDVRARRVEVGVVRDDLAGPSDRREQDPLRRSSLMRGDHVLEREELLDRREEAEPRWRSGIALVTVLDRGPLVARHRAGPRIGQEVDEDVLGAQVEQVVAGLADLLAAFRLRRQPKRLDRVDPERLDDRLEGWRHGRSIRARVLRPGGELRSRVEGARAVLEDRLDASDHLTTIARHAPREQRAEQS